MATTETMETEAGRAATGRVCALIPAAGRGVRFGGPENKVFAPLLGRPLLGWTLQAFADCQSVDDIILIGGESDLSRLREIGQAFGGGKVRDVVLGGDDRQASVRNGLAACTNAEYIIVHDGARPYVTQEIIDNTLWRAKHFGAATAAWPVADTLARQSSTDEEQKRQIAADKQDPTGPWADQAMVSYKAVHEWGEAIPRAGVWAIQTPQTFRADLLRSAHRQAENAGFSGTDDAGLVHRLGETVAFVKGSPAPKVTLSTDILLNEALLKAQKPLKPTPFPTFRIGYGYDVHPFAPASENRTLYIGGVAFPEAERGLAGHSDADVLLHALCDALLGAAGMGDIGQLFPPSDNRHKNRASLEFLQEVADRLNGDGWQVANVDMTVIAEAPKINPRVQEMKSKIGVVLNIGPTEVGIKATTSEGLGFVGRGEGIAAHATALLMRP